MINLNNVTLPQSNKVLIDYVQKVALTQHIGVNKIILQSAGDFLFQNNTLHHIATEDVIVISTDKFNNCTIHVGDDDPDSGKAFYFNYVPDAVLEVVGEIDFRKCFDFHAFKPAGSERQVYGLV